MSAIGGVIASIAALVHMGEHRRNSDYLSHERRKFEQKQARRVKPDYGDVPRRYRNVGS